jgi:hypothetical protein
VESELVSGSEQKARRQPQKEEIQEQKSAQRKTEEAGSDEGRCSNAWHRKNAGYDEHPFSRSVKSLF